MIEIYFNDWQIMEFMTVTSSDSQVEILGKWWEILVVAKIGYAPKGCSDMGVLAVKWMT